MNTVCKPWCKITPLVSDIIEVRLDDPVSFSSINEPAVQVFVIFYLFPVIIFFKNLLGNGDGAEHDSRQNCRK